MWVGNLKLKGVDRSVESMVIGVQCALLTLSFQRRACQCEMQIARPTSKVVMSYYVMVDIDCQKEIAGYSVRRLLC